MLIQKNTHVIQLEEPAAEKIQIPPKISTWSQRRAALEQADREKAAILQKHSADVEELEKELGISDANSQA